MSPKVQAAILAAVALLLSVFFAVSIPLTSPNPMFQGLNPDERDHVFYARKIRETRSLVRFPASEIRAARQKDPKSTAFAEYAETHQPPLYYVAGAFSGGSLMPLRWLSVILGAATVILAFVAARDLFPSRPEVAWGAAGLLATLPAFAQLSGAANNDTVTTLLCTGIFWRLGRLVKSGGTFRDASILGAWLGVGLWAKLTVLQLFPAVALAYLLSPREKGWLIRAVVAFGAALLIASPWLIRNATLYGDPLNLAIFPLTAPPGSPTPEFMLSIPGLGLTRATYIGLVAERTFATFFYIIPPNQAPPWPKTPAVSLVAILCMTAILGLLKLGRSSVNGERRLLAFFVMAPVILLPFFVLFERRFFQAQGRYFHPALFPVMCTLAWGISALAGSNWAGRALGLACGLLAVLSALQATSLCQIL